MGIWVAVLWYAYNSLESRHPDLKQVLKFDDDDMMDFSSFVRNWGACSTIQSPPELKKKSFGKWRVARMH